MSITPPHKRIEDISFSPISNDVIERKSQVSITNKNLFFAGGKGTISGGLYDTHMGTTDYSILCGTCLGNKKTCPGHFGSYDLQYPIITPTAIKLDIIKNWLNLVCLECGTPIRDISKYKSLKSASVDKNDGKKCPECNKIHPKITKPKKEHTFYKVSYSNDILDSKLLLPKELLNIFNKISDQVAIKLHAVHPRNLIHNSILIPPVTTRANQKGTESGIFIRNDITLNYQTIIKFLTSVKFSPDDSKQVRMLNEAIYNTIIGTSTQPKAVERSLVPGGNQALYRNLSGKTGLVRFGLMGKSSWSTSRTVISGKTSLNPRDVEIPRTFARILQIKEEYRPFNKSRLDIHIKNGKREYPGCTRIIKNGKTFDIELFLANGGVVSQGNIIQRDIVDGDLLFLNRQPSLERNSIGAHRAIVSSETDTFRMNVISCPWYNADFDGDQMMMWIPHSIGSRVEAEILSLVDNWFISGKTAGPIPGMIQDTVVGGAELTSSDVKINKKHMIWILNNINISSIELPQGKDGYFSGKDVITALIKKTGINYTGKPKYFNEGYQSFIYYSDDEKLTKIENGVMMSGIIDKKAVGSGSTGGILHQIAVSRGFSEALDITYNLQQAILNFLYCRGFTVSIGDLYISSNTENILNKIINEKRKKSKILSEKLVNSEIISPIGMTVHEFYEFSQMEVTKVTDEPLQAILPGISKKTNGLFKMIATGSKGTNSNLIHIKGVIGSVVINQRRISEQNGYRRTLPYFPRFCLSPEAYGFISSSYIKGMNAPEFICSGMSGRFDLITKALSTGSTGYRMRKSVMCMQSIITDNFRRCMINDQIIQLLYGEIGVDTRYLEYVRLTTVFLNNEQIESKFSDKSSNDEIKKIIDDRDIFRKMIIKFEDIDFNRPFKDEVMTPVNVSRIINEIIKSRRHSKGKKTKKIDEIFKDINNFTETLPRIFFNIAMSGQMIPDYIKCATFIVQMQLRYELCKKRIKSLLDEFGSNIFEEIKIKIYDRYLKSLVNYGDAVGILAAQATGEPLTQYMLDSHHRSVEGGTNKTGIIRVEEIFGAKSPEKERSPEMLLRIRKNESSELEVQEIAKSIECIIFKIFVKEYNILYESFPIPKFPPTKGDYTWIAQSLHNTPVKPPSDMTEWCFRFSLDISLMVAKSIDIEFIVTKLYEVFKHIYIIHSPENAGENIIRIYIRNDLLPQKKKRKESIFDYMSSLCRQILGTKLRGISNIIAARTYPIIRHNINEKTGVIESAGKIFGIKTIGSNVSGLFNSDKIDVSKISSSSVGETFKIFGIEAARQKIISEILAFMGDSAPLYHHILLFADTMTKTGEVTSIEPKGLAAREPKNILQRVTFAAPIDTLIKASYDKVTSHVYGVSAPLALGQMPKIGSYFNDITTNVDFIKGHILKST